MKPPANGAERQLVLETLAAIVGGFAGALGRNVEVVVHDLRHPERSVVAIANGQVSGRAVGSPIITGPLEDKGFDGLFAGRQPVAVLSDYRTRTRDGRDLRSSTVIFRDKGGKPFAALCVNADLSAFQRMQSVLQSVLGEAPSARAEPASGAAPNAGPLVDTIIAEAIQAEHKSVAEMAKSDKKRAVETMNKRGLFLIRGAVEKAADALNVSRFTVYKYVEEIRRDSAPKRDAPARRRAGAVT